MKDRQSLKDIKESRCAHHSSALWSHHAPLLPTLITSFRDPDNVLHNSVLFLSSDITKHAPHFHNVRTQHRRLVHMERLASRHNTRSILVRSALDAVDVKAAEWPNVGVDGELRGGNATQAGENVELDRCWGCCLGLAGWVGVDGEGDAVVLVTS